MLWRRYGAPDGGAAIILLLCIEAQWFWPLRLGHWLSGWVLELALVTAFTVMLEVEVELVLVVLLVILLMVV